MRNVVRIAVLALFLANLASVGVVLPAAATVGPSITNLTVEPGPFIVDGLLGTASTTVSVDVHDVKGVNSCQDSPGPGGDVLVLLTRTAGGAPDRVEVYLDRTSGTDIDGTWTGVWRIASTRGGTWTITYVGWCDDNMDATWSTDPRVNPGVVRAVSVVGTHVPRIAATRVPTVARFGARQDVVYTFYGSSGGPLVRHPISYGDDNFCGMNGNGSRLLTTDAAGRLDIQAEGGLQCLYFSNPPKANLGKYVGLTLLAKVWVQRREFAKFVSAYPSAPVVRSGHPVDVNGAVAPTAVTYPGTWTVGLERQVKGQWVGVATARVRASGRYTLALTRAGSLGRQTYRVLARGPVGSSIAPTASRNFVVAGC